MPEFLQLTSRMEALQAFLSALPAPNRPAETLPTVQAGGRILADDIVSAEMSPPFSRATVDGYAVRAADTFGDSESLPGYLPLAGEVPMGQAAAEDLLPGTAWLIHTGGMLPPGADAVVMLEDTQKAGVNEIEISKAVAAGENTILAGEDVMPGDVVLQKGALIGPAQIGGLLALGIRQVKVIKQPLVGILSSGDEVIPPEQTPGPGQIRDINSYSLQALVERHGGRARLYGIAPDELHAFEKRIRQAYEECDMLVVTAGSSASTRDLTSTVIQTLGQPGVLVHGVRIRPGKPTILAVCDGKPVIGLPGNPVSALVIAGFFVIPALERISGKTTPTPPAVLMAELTKPVPSVAGREDFVPVHLTCPQGVWKAEPIFFKSNMIFTLARADGLLRVPASAVGLTAGERVEVYLPL